jgi:hypothetical protein
MANLHRITSDLIFLLVAFYLIVIVFPAILAYLFSR